MASGVKDLTGTVVAQIISACLAIAIQSCLAYFLLPEGRGSYAVCLIFSTLLSLVFSFGCETSLVYFVASKRLSISEAITYSFVIGSFVSIAAIFTGLAILELPFSFTYKATSGAFSLALIYIPILLFVTIYIQIITCLDQFPIYNLFIVLREINRLIFLLILVLWFSLGLKGALLASILSDSVMIFLILGFYRLRYNIKLVRPKLIRIKEILSYGIRFYLGRLSAMVNVQLGTIVLSFFATQEEIGLFSVAMALTVRVQMIPDAFSTVLFPRVANDQIERKNIVAQCTRINVIICCILLMIIALFAVPIVNILFSSAFLPCVHIIRILIIGNIARCAGKMFVPYLLGTNHPGVASISVAIGMSANILIMYFLLPVYGLSGAAISVSVASFISTALLTISFIHYSGLTIRDILDFKRTDWEPVWLIIPDKFKKLKITKR